MNGTTGPLRSYVRQTLFHRFDPVVRTFETRLPSEIPEARFQLTIRAEWPPGTPTGQSLGSLAEPLLKVIRPVAERYSVMDCDEAHAAIEQAILGAAGLWESGPSTLTVDVRVGEDDRSLAEQQEALHRETALIRDRRLQESERLRVLLADPTTARLWWLENKPERLVQLQDQKMEGVFEKIAALFGESAGRSAADPIAELIRLFLQGLDSRFRERLVDQLGVVFHAYERNDLAASLHAD
jgi:hypothetical protein